MNEGLARSYFIFLQDWFCRGHEIFFSQLHEYPANPEVGHGTINILKCLNFTRIGARTLSNELRRENGVENLWKEKEHKRIKEDSSGRSGRPPLKLILEQLEEPVPEETEKAIESAERLRTNIKRLPENWRHKLVDSLQQRHVSTMWMIAGYNYIDCAADLLPSVERKPPLTVKGKAPVLERKPPVWKGKIHRIFGNWPSRMGYIFGNGDFKMRFSRDNNGLVYGEIVGGFLLEVDCKYCLLIIFKAWRVYIIPFQRMPFETRYIKSLATSHLNIGIGKILTGGEIRVWRLDNNVKRWNPYEKTAKQPKKFMDKLFHIRCAGPNVVVAQARREDGLNSGEIVLIKIC